MRSNDVQSGHEDGRVALRADESPTPGPVSHVGRLLNIPTELFLQIASYLDVPDILALRQTCTRIHQLTYDRSVWLSLVQALKHSLPLPAPFACDPIHVSLSLSDETLEKVVVSAYRIERGWLEPRRPPIPISLRPKAGLELESDGKNSSAKTILVLDVLSDRWLLCVYQEQLVELWDLLPNGTAATSHLQDATEPVLFTSQQLSGTDTCTSSCACLDEDGTSMIIAVTSNSTGCTILRVSLPIKNEPDTPADAHIKTLAVIRMPNPMLLARALYPAAHLVFFSYSSSYALANYETQKQWPMDVSEQDEDQLWNGVVAARFITAQHLLCVKAHAVELYTLPSHHDEDDLSPSERDPNIHAQPLAHAFPITTFRGASLSLPQIFRPARSHTSCPPSERDNIQMSIYFLAYDILRGLFHYHVSLSLPFPSATDSTARSSEGIAPAHMSVRLLAAHHMAVPFGSAAAGTQLSARVPRSGLTPGARGFISTCVMGFTGRRGVWVERRRGSVRRGIVGFSAALDALDSIEETPAEQAEQAVDPQRENSSIPDDAVAGERNWWDDPGSLAIDGKTIFEVNSYDLRDDITHCAFSEATGKVVLGTRNGEIQLL